MVLRSQLSTANSSPEEQLSHWLKKSQLRPRDRIPKTYDRRVFVLDGRLDLDVSLNGVTMCTPIYIKVDAADQLLLGEGVCRQLKIITYHPSISSKKNRRENQQARTQRAPETGAVFEANTRRATKEMEKGTIVIGGSEYNRRIQRTQRKPGVKYH